MMDDGEKTTPAGRHGCDSQIFASDACPVGLLIIGSADFRNSLESQPCLHDSPSLLILGFTDQ